MLIDVHMKLYLLQPSQLLLDGPMRLGLVHDPQHLLLLFPLSSRLGCHQLVSLFRIHAVRSNRN